MNDEKEKPYVPRRTFFIRIVPQLLPKIFAHGASVSFDVNKGFPLDTTLKEVVVAPGGIIDVLFTSRMLDIYTDENPDEVVEVQAASSLILPAGAETNSRYSPETVGCFEWTIRVNRMPYQREKKVLKQQEKNARKQKDKKDRKARS